MCAARVMQMCMQQNEYSIVNPQLLIFKQSKEKPQNEKRQQLPAQLNNYPMAPCSAPNL